MKVAVASDDASSISPTTDQCRGFVVFEVVGGEMKRVEYRPSSRSGPERTDSRLPEPVVATVFDCQALVTRDVGPRLLADLNVQGIAPYTCTVEDVEEAAGLFARGELFRVRGRDYAG